ncbi:MAG: hypothetical protein AB1847_20695 [bacterium]
MIRKGWKLIQLKTKISRMRRTIIDIFVHREDTLWQWFAAMVLCLCLISAAGCGQSQSKVASRDEANESVGEVATRDEVDEVNESVKPEAGIHPLTRKRESIKAATDTTLDIDPNIAEKLDPALKRKLAELTKEDRLDEYLGIIGKYAGVESQELRQKVSDLGCSVGTVTSSFFTTECQAGDILDLAKFDFVTYLELAKEVYPSDQHNHKNHGGCER